MILTEFGIGGLSGRQGLQLADKIASSALNLLNEIF